MSILSIALTNLGKYNEGTLDYTWLNLPASEEEIGQAFDRISVSHDDTHYYSVYGKEYGEYEEYFITDYETEIEGLEVGEYSNLEALNEICEAIDNLDTFEKETVEAILEAGIYNNLEEAINNIDNVTFYSGDPDNILDEMINEQISCLTYGNKIPDLFTSYFDYEAYKRDLMFDYIEVSNGLIARY